MSRLAKWLIGIVAAVAVLILGVWLWLWFAFRGTPSDIVNFHPRELQAKADAAFFFSVGDELKYSVEIDPRATTLSRGRLPKDTRVYLALTTEDISRYRISCGGIMPN